MIGLDLGLAMSAQCGNRVNIFATAAGRQIYPIPQPLPRIIREGEYRFGRSGDRDFSPPNTAS